MLSGRVTSLNAPLAKKSADVKVRRDDPVARYEWREWVVAQRRPN